MSKNNLVFDYYFKKGANSDSPILFLHGFWSSYKIGLGFANKVQDQDFWGLNFPGHGNTPVTQRPLNFQDLVQATKSFIDEKQLTNITLIGHSMGGGVATVLAYLYPELFKRVICISPLNPFEFDQPNNLERYFFAKNFADYQVLISKIYKNGAQMLQTPQFLRGLETKFNREGRNNLVMHELYASLFTPQNHAQLLSAYAQNQLPWLFVLGKYDGISDAQKVAPLYLEHANKAQVQIMPNVAHVALYEDPDGFYQVYEEFIHAKTT